VFCRSLFVLFPLAIVLSVLLRITASDHTFGNFILCFLADQSMQRNSWDNLPMVPLIYVTQMKWKQNDTSPESQHHSIILKM